MKFTVSKPEPNMSYRNKNGSIVIPDRLETPTKPKETIAGAIIVDSLGARANPNYKRIGEFK
jgi:hypothetical protein